MTQTGPWYRRARRWCQTNWSQIDPSEPNLPFWRNFWRENHIQGIVVNFGGIVAYYPSPDPLQYVSPYLAGGDLVLDTLHAAREEGLSVLARMDINRGDRALLERRPQWFSRDKQGRPYPAGDRYVTCVNSGYYKEFIPSTLRYLIAKYAPDGFTDNSWQGLGAGNICYCDNCREKFLAQRGLALPEAADWEDPVYRAWVDWSVGCRMENFRLYNRVCREAGGPDCLWLGMVNANPVGQHCALYDLKEIGASSPVMMSDHQSRDGLNGFEQNSLNGLLLHGLCGASALVPESMASYARGVYTFRRGANPPQERQAWMRCGMAGGLSPWLHFIGAVQEDRRMFQSGKPLMDWHLAVEPYLYDREPLADIGLVWSQDNTRFYGRDDPQRRCGHPFRGFTRALTQGRFAYLPVHADHIRRDGPKLRLLVLPDVALLTDEQEEALLDFLRAGGSVLLTGRTGLLTGLGEPRSSSRLDALLGLSRRLDGLNAHGQAASWEAWPLHNYLRLPRERHPALAGFEDTDILAFGGEFTPCRPEDEAWQVLATYVPPFPIYPPEFSYMPPEARDSGQPLLLARETGFGGRACYLSADIDRRYGEAAHPDQGLLLQNLLRWCLADRPLLEVRGRGYLDVRLYRQGQRLLLHLNNLSGMEQNPGFAQSPYPTGPLEILLRLPPAGYSSARLLPEGRPVRLEAGQDQLRLCLDSLEEQALLCIE